ncbi:hypothetical protein [Nocardia miyunensis]|uniref:hypothetical protein n=1 Tax=Nocardia miyunensis TaxID=282684 RepID=UPI00082D63A1|nr:hypothetical protein [Nocardia miyunensis]
MPVHTAEWLISSDIVDEVAFRVDVPGRAQGRWIVSFLPPEFRLTEAQALTCLELAEMVLLALDSPVDSLELEFARIRATEVELSLEDLMWLLAVRSTTLREHPAPETSGSSAQA